ncbi:MAG: hypothetical protein HRT44_12230, partial [Bdellovibrionales bacterium]|nr:hypothetical protein [Bdellovibrionales bacterium]NQZ20006.1 hypothetical protein [Bdellovibrionales bacterium]
RYISETGTRYLFGCSSIDSTDPKEVFKVVKSLEAKNNVSYEFKINPTDKYTFDQPESHLESAKPDPKILRSLPPLLRSYLHAGSKVHGFPALDEDFKCADLFTILDLRQLNKKFAERYNPQWT